MGIKPEEEALLRQYLLGTLPESEWDPIERELLTNDDFAQTVEVVEDEIVDDYLDGTLSRADKRAVERHFLRSPEHHHKLQFARLLRSHLRKEKPPERPYFVPPAIRPQIFWAGFTAIAALLLLTAGLGVYTARLRQSLQSEMARNRTAQANFKTQLDQENAQVAELKRQVQDLRDENTTLQASAESPPIVLNLQPLEREGDSVPIVKRSSKAKLLEFHVSTKDFPSPSYAVSLKDRNGKELRSWANLKARHNLLTFTAPLRLLRAGEYSVVITGEQKSQPYPFRAE